MQDYEKIARVIRYLDEHHADQPRLETLAREARLSPFHLHRLFVSWAGVTPKDFLQCLTSAHARHLLRRGQTVLDVALDTGLSGPGRLHDLCVSLEAATPGELKSGGEHWTIVAGFSSSPFGTCLVGQGPRGLCHLAFVDSDEHTRAWTDLVQDWPEARVRRDDGVAAELVEQIFVRAAPDQKPLRAFVKGTAFQVRVWRALVQIPSGSLVSYGWLAREAGFPTAVRAVGTAVGRNRLAYVIPCHRVIRGTGVWGGYRWGQVRKRMLVAWETAPAARDYEGTISPCTHV